MRPDGYMMSNMPLKHYFSSFICLSEQTSGSSSLLILIILFLIFLLWFTVYALVLAVFELYSTLTLTIIRAVLMFFVVDVIASCRTVKRSRIKVMEAHYVAILHALFRSGLSASLVGTPFVLIYANSEAGLDVSGVSVVINLPRSLSSS